MVSVSMKDRSKRGSNFGHQTKRWNTKRSIISSATQRHLILDLQKTIRKFARPPVRHEPRRSVGESCSSYQAASPASRPEEAERAGMHYVNVRWMGGTLTNFRT